MTKLAGFLTLSILAATTFLACGQQNGLERFLIAKMLEYPTWIKSQSLDPSSPRTTETFTFIDNRERTLVNITVEMRNLYVSGHSINNDPPRQIEGDLNEKVFYIWRNTTTTLAGTYKATGKVRASSDRIIPFSGQGKFKVGVKPDFQLNYEMIEIENYAITEGKIDIAPAKISFSPNSPPGWEVLEFEGLLDDPELTPYTVNILQTIWGNILNNNNRLDSIHPSRFILIDYLNLLFSENTLEEIVQWPPA